MTYRSKVATVFLLGFFLDLINMFIASVAFPAMGRMLHASVGELAWVSNGYIAGLTLVLPFSAWLSQQFGTRRVFLLSLSIFSFGALAAGMADSLTSLVVWRALQGMGGGLLIPPGQSLTWQQFRPHERAKLSAAVMLVGLLAPACSPAIGGVLVQSLSWRWVFFASLPIALLTFGLAALWIKDERRVARPGGLLRLSLLRDPLLRFSMLVYLCVPGTFIGINVVGMFYLQSVTGMSPSAIGALIIGTAAGIATFRNIPILTIVDNFAVHRLYRLLSHRLDLSGLRLHRLRLYRARLRNVIGWRRDQHSGIRAGRRSPASRADRRRRIVGAAAACQPQ